MASTEFNSSDPQSVKRWCTEMVKEAIDKTYMRRFLGKGPENILMLLTDLEKQAGDTIYFDLLMQMRNDGVDGDSELSQYEEPLEFRQDTLFINQKRNAHSYKTMSQQRTIHDLRRAARGNLTDWYARVYDALMFAYLAGTPGDGNESIASMLYPDGAGNFAGFAANPIQPPDANHLVDRSTEIMDLRAIDIALERAKYINPRIQPTMVDGEPKYVLVMHPFQVTGLKSVSEEAQWNMIQQRAGVRGGSNPIYTGALGEYNGVVLHESEYIPIDTTSGSERAHAVFLGRQAGVFAMGNAWKPNKRKRAGGGSFFSWIEEERDYGNVDGVGVAAIFGVKKSRYVPPDGSTPTDHAVIRITTADKAS